jgi:hypothetical protein
MLTATIDEFVAGAFFDEMGLTVPAPPRVFSQDSDQVPDPEIDAQTIIDVANFIAFSESPGQPLSAIDEEGLKHFRDLGCTGCHWSSFTVEGKATPQMWSDLLAHDMGPELAETLNDELTPGSYYRTTPLWGLRNHPGPYLHDSSAGTLEEAIRKHAGEASASRTAWEALPSEGRDAVLRMLKQL